MHYGENAGAIAALRKLKSFDEGKQSRRQEPDALSGKQGERGQHSAKAGLGGESGEAECGAGHERNGQGNLGSPAYRLGDIQREE